MKRVLTIFYTFIISFFSISTVSCSNLDDKLKVVVNELNQNISKVLFQGTQLDVKLDIENNLDVLYWKNFDRNVNNFLANIYTPNTGIVRPEYRSFFSNLGYKNISTDVNALKYLKINIDKKVGLANIGMVFSNIHISQKPGYDIKITFENIRVYFNFSDPIHGIYKEYYFSDSKKIYPNFNSASLYFPVPTNNLNNETFEQWKVNHDTSNFLKEKMQLLFLKLWFDWKLNPDRIQDLLVSGTPLLSIIDSDNGIKISKYNIFNMITSNLFGITKLSSLKLKRNGVILKNTSLYTLKINDILIFNVNFNFISYNLNFEINIKILR